MYELCYVYPEEDMYKLASVYELCYVYPEGDMYCINLPLCMNSVMYTQKETCINLPGLAEEDILVFQVDFFQPELK